jgi:hypothetical protein
MKVRGGARGILLASCGEHEQQISTHCLGLASLAAPSVLTLRALTIKDGAYDDGGGLHLREDCVVVLLLCVFVDCRNNVNDDSRAIYLSNAAHSSNSGATTTHIIIRGTRIHSNIKVESGSDIYVSDGALEIMR